MTSTVRTPWSRRARAVAVAAALVLAALGAGGAGAPRAVAQGAADDDPNLQQRIRAGQKVVSDRKVLSAGHVDVGPRFVDGRWTLMIHDDVAKADPGGESVWRHAERTVLRVTDDAILAVPDDPTYGFLPAKPGDRVHVIPQTQDLDVVWLGWNTQDPETMKTIDRGVTMTLTGVEGPGDLAVYLQSGDFGDPQELWDSTKSAKPAWVDVNTHTHANWVFTKPGTYLARVRIDAELIDGRKVSDTRDLRFAVGSDVPTAEAFAATWSGPDPAPTADREPTTAADEAGEGNSSGAIVAVIVVLAAALGGGLVAIVVRGDRAKRRARATGDEPADRAGEERG